MRRLPLRCNLPPWPFPRPSWSRHRGCLRQVRAGCRCSVRRLRASEHSVGAVALARQALLRHGWIPDRRYFTDSRIGVSSAFVDARRIGLPADPAWRYTVSHRVAPLPWYLDVLPRRDPVPSLALFVTTTFLFSPWMDNDDTVVFDRSWRCGANGPTTGRPTIALALAVWTLPLSMLPLAIAKIPSAMLVLPAFAGRPIWRPLPARPRSPGMSFSQRRSRDLRQSCLAGRSHSPI